MGEMATLLLFLKMGASSPVMRPSVSAIVCRIGVRWIFVTNASIPAFMHASSPCTVAEKPRMGVRLAPLDFSHARMAVHAPAPWSFGMRLSMMMMSNISLPHACCVSATACSPSVHVVTAMPASLNTVLSALRVNSSSSATSTRRPEHALRQL